mmetsp:Transcript_12364/g.40601  ORF Transcript_12364/g.40601 Transcript_12364/m.40601 type:complete len:256 (+) Transcript_12364:383-1150(+)
MFTRSRSPTSSHFHFLRVVAVGLFRAVPDGLQPIEQLHSPQDRRRRVGHGPPAQPPVIRHQQQRWLLQLAECDDSRAEFLQPTNQVCRPLALRFVEGDHVRGIAEMREAARLEERLAPHALRLAGHSALSCGDDDRSGHIPFLEQLDGLMRAQGLGSPGVGSGSCDGLDHPHQAVVCAFELAGEVDTGTARRVVPYTITEVAVVGCSIVDRSGDTLMRAICGVQSRQDAPCQRRQPARKVVALNTGHNRPRGHRL